MVDFDPTNDYEPAFIVPTEEISSTILTRELIRSDIPNAINAGLGVEATIRAYREAGLRFTDSVVRDIYHTTKGEMFAESDPMVERIRAMPLDDVIGDSLRAISSWEYNERYVDVVRLTVYVQQTGDVKDINFRYYHDDPLTVREVIEAAIETFNEPAEGQASYYYAVAGSVIGAQLSANFA